MVDTVQPAHQQALHPQNERIARIHVNDYLACYQPGDHDNTIATWTKACPDDRWNSYADNAFLSRDEVSLYV